MFHALASITRRPMAASAFVCALAGAFAPMAHAGPVLATGTIVNIDATSSAGTRVTLEPGTYQVTWAGKAGGGLYDAWTYNTAPSGNFRDVFSVTVDGLTTTYDRNDGNLNYNQYGTAAQAIADFSGSEAGSSFLVYQGGAEAGQLFFVDGPITFTPTKTATYVFSVPDYWFWDNSGGVSLRLQPLTAAGGSVPTPASWILVLTAMAATAGIVHLGRRRRESNAEV